MSVPGETPVDFTGEEPPSPTEGLEEEFVDQFPSDGDLFTETADGNIVLVPPREYIEELLAGVDKVTEGLSSISEEAATEFGSIDDMLTGGFNPAVFGQIANTLDDVADILDGIEGIPDVVVNSLRGAAICIRDVLETPEDTTEEELNTAIDCVINNLGEGAAGTGNQDINEGVDTINTALDTFREEIITDTLRMITVRIIYTLYGEAKLGVGST